MIPQKFKYLYADFLRFGMELKVDKVHGKLMYKQNIATE